MRAVVVGLLALLSSGCICTRIGCGGLVLLDVALAGPAAGAIAIACHDEACETVEIPWGTAAGTSLALGDGTSLLVGADRLVWRSTEWELPAGIDVGDVYALEVLADDATPLGSDERTVVALGQFHPNGPQCGPACATVTLE